MGLERLGEGWRRLLFLLRRRQFERELEEELRFHTDRRAEAYSQAGMASEDARRRVTWGMPIAACAATLVSRRWLF